MRAAAHVALEFGAPKHRRRRKQQPISVELLVSAFGLHVPPLGTKPRPKVAASFLRHAIAAQSSFDGI